MQRLSWCYCGSSKRLIQMRCLSFVLLWFFLTFDFVVSSHNRATLIFPWGSVYQPWAAMFLMSMLLPGKSSVKIAASIALPSPSSTGPLSDDHLTIRTKRSQEIIDTQFCIYFISSRRNFRYLFNVLIHYPSLLVFG